MDIAKQFVSIGADIGFHCGDGVTGTSFAALFQSGDIDLNDAICGEGRVHDLHWNTGDRVVDAVLGRLSATVTTFRPLVEGARSPTPEEIDELSCIVVECEALLPGPVKAFLPATVSDLESAGVRRDNPEAAWAWSRTVLDGLEEGLLRLIGMDFSIIDGSQRAAPEPETERLAPMRGLPAAK
ncbi:hypothetical protein [Tranquillimonas rosea]|uniref:hypothetical protein n=1 Tax=Tranquillimonas rosea TaxID=641238 RepID=UPI003BACE885